MSMLKLGFALEGNSDYPVLPRFAHRLISEHNPEIRLAPDSVLRPRKRGHGFIQELPGFARQLSADGVDIVIAVVDTDSTQINDRRRLLQEAKQRCYALQVAVCIAEGLAVHALEAWLLADETAIFQVFDGDHHSIAFSSPEQNPTPKATLNSIVRILTGGLEVSFVPFALDLVDAIRLDLLRQRNPHFDDFARNLINCVREWERV